MARRVLILVVLLAAVSCLAQQGLGNDCTLAGTWYGGSVVAYQFTIIPAGPAGHYITFAQGFYKNAVMNTVYSGTLEKRGNKYEGSGMALLTQDPDFLNPPPLGKLPDIIAGWFITELTDCNTIKSTIPFLGLYFGRPMPPQIKGIWEPGTPWTGINWVANGVAPMFDAPDVDMIPVLTGGETKPIVETYHRLPMSVNPTLLHHN